MTAKNDITGDSIKTKGNSNAYRDNWDKIFKKDTVKNDESPRIENPQDSEVDTRSSGQH